MNVDKIFASNGTVLKSADQIHVGQKLIIPAISDVVTSYKKVSTVKSTIKKTSFAKAKVYIVRDGDSLWKIAASQLGNGSRYAELASLNSGIIDDEDNLTVGTRLKLPRK
ncbi:MAG: LysM peptidoglycan-binding domain-containing protein [Planctomycetes bacterium]|nr:LysM peptidoglycan-binding domain-containing protein [Planctomycetota bacterium]MCK5473476.1 LysM peptidoglycan-binding domain-containing protein [Planctomycetota bacterium]